MKHKILWITLTIVGILAIITGVGLLYISNSESAYCIVQEVRETKTNSCKIEYETLDNYISSLKTYMDTIDITECVQVGYDEVMAKVSLNELYEIKGILGKLKQNTRIITLHKSYDKGLLMDILLEYNIKQPRALDAYIDKSSEGMYKIVPEQYGLQIDTNKLLSDIQSIQDIHNIKVSDYTIPPEIKSEYYAELVEKANDILSWEISYDSGKSYRVGIENVTIDTENKEVCIEEAFIDDIIHDLESDYDKIGQAVTVQINNGESKQISGGTWGTLMNSAKEREYIKSSIQGGASASETNRRPIMKQDYTELGDTYIEVSIGKQHLWYYKNGKLQSETNVVTGDVSKKRGTPSGVYFISERVNGKYLTGADYKTWVNKWMRLTNTGIGLHDAGWRGSFGGNIYKGNGSHGCINLPKNYAYSLYDVTYVGMPVIIY